MPSTLGIVSSHYYDYPPPSFTGQTVLQLEGEGVDGAQNNTFLDSTGNNTLTRNGSVTQGSFSPFPIAAGSAYNPLVNGGSGHFNGTSNNYLRLNASNSVVFGTGDFTIEAWANTQLINATDFTGIGGTLASSVDSTLGVSIGFNTAGKPLVRLGKSVAGQSFDLTSSNTASLNTWIHIAATRSGGTVRLFVDGQLQAQGANSFNLALNVCCIGRMYPNFDGARFTGYISDFRIVKGAALYTSNFTRPTSPVTPTSNGGATPSTPPGTGQTSLLCNFTNGGVIDSAGKNDIITVDNARISTADKKNGNSSIYFDGTGDVLKIPHSSNFLFGTSDFMISMWVNPVNLSGTTTSRTLYSKRLNTGVARDAGITIWTTGSTLQARIVFTAIDIPTIVSSRNLTTGSWQHIVLLRQGSVFTLYLNGRPVGSTTNGGSINDNVTASITIGADSDATTNYSNCYIDNVLVMRNP